MKILSLLWVALLLLSAGAESVPAESREKAQTSASTESVLYFPDYVDGEGWSVQLVLNNIDPARGAPVEVEVFDQQGRPVPRFFDSEGSFEIPARGSRILRSPGERSIQRGWIQVETESAPIHGLLTYRHAESGIEVGVEPVALSDHFALFVEESSEIGTGLAIFKPDASSEIEFQFRDEAGLDPLGRVLTQGNFQQRARVIPEWFAGVDTGFLDRGLLFLRAAEFQFRDEAGLDPLGRVLTQGGAPVEFPATGPRHTGMVRGGRYGIPRRLSGASVLAGRGRFQGIRSGGTAGRGRFALRGPGDPDQERGRRQDVLDGRGDGQDPTGEPGRKRCGRPHHLRSELPSRLGAGSGRRQDVLDGLGGGKDPAGELGRNRDGGPHHLRDGWPHRKNDVRGLGAGAGCGRGQDVLRQRVRRATQDLACKPGRIRGGGPPDLGTEFRRCHPCGAGPGRRQDVLDGLRGGGDRACQPGRIPGRGPHLLHRGIGLSRRFGAGCGHGQDVLDRRGDNKDPAGELGRIRGGGPPNPGTGIGSQPPATGAGSGCRQGLLVEQERAEDPADESGRQRGGGSRHHGVEFAIRHCPGLGQPGPGRRPGRPAAGSGSGLARGQRLHAEARSVLRLEGHRPQSGRKPVGCDDVALLPLEQRDDIAARHSGGNGRGPPSCRLRLQRRVDPIDGPFERRNLLLRRLCRRCQRGELDRKQLFDGRAGDGQRGRPDWGRRQDVLDGLEHGQDPAGEPGRERGGGPRLGIGRTLRAGVGPGRRQDVLDGLEHGQDPAGEPGREQGGRPRHHGIEFARRLGAGPWRRQDVLDGLEDAQDPAGEPGRQRGGGPSRLPGRAGARRAGAGP